MRFPLALLFFTLVTECYSQVSPRQVSTIELSQIETSVKLDSLMMMYFDTSWSTKFTNVPFEAYSPPPQVAGGHWWYSSYFHIAVHNDTRNSYPGVIYVAKTGQNEVARVNEKGEIIQWLEPSTSPELFKEKYFTFEIPADSTWHLVIHAQSQLKFYHVSAWVMKASMFNMFMKAYTSSFVGTTFFYSIIGGMMAMMLLYVLSQFTLIRKLNTATTQLTFLSCYCFCWMMRLKF
ncbi:MAG: hypothetical protein WDO15_29280 [Bacteroidota bacterium]